MGNSKTTSNKNKNNIDRLLESCGKSSKVMRQVAADLRQIGLVSQADLLEQAEQNMNACAVIHFEDTQPISIY